MLSLQQLPQALYSGLSLVSSSAGPDSVTSPTVGYNIIPSDIPFTTSHIAHGPLCFRKAFTLISNFICHRFLFISVTVQHSSNDTSLKVVLLIFLLLVRVL